MSLSDAIAAQIMGELHDLTLKIEAQQARIEKVAEVVVAAARAVDSGKAILHRQNEAFLMDRVKEITAAVNVVKGVEEGMQLAASQQAQTLLEPLIQSMSQHVQKMTAKDIAAGRFMETTNKTQETIANSMHWAIIGAMVFGAMLFCAGIGIGHLWK